MSAVGGSVAAMTSPSERIARYFVLAARPDAESYFAQFAPDVVVEDDGRTHVGIDAVRSWRRSVPGVSYAVRGVVPDGDGGHLACADISGDFPGSPVLLDFAFTFGDDGRITRLVIAP